MILLAAAVAAWIVCPGFQDLSLGRKSRAASSPAVMAAVMPPAVALRPPDKNSQKALLVHRLPNALG